MCLRLIRSSEKLDKHAVLLNESAFFFNIMYMENTYCAATNALNITVKKYTPSRKETVQVHYNKSTKIFLEISIFIIIFVS